jgi:hypothetical protein
MKLGELYRFAVTEGIAVDPRGKEFVEQQLKQLAEEYSQMKDKEKEFFDQERLSNPYADTRILYGDENIEVGSILAGIDMEVGEVLLADRLKEKGRRIDLVLSHHPEGTALARLYQVMHMQEDLAAMLGVPINVAEGVLKERISQVERALLPTNHQRARDAARLLDIPLMCIHTPADNHVASYLEQKFDKNSPRIVGDVLELLLEEPEYAQAKSDEAGLKIVAGDKKGRAGKVFVDMTGGTGGSKDMFEKYAVAGVGTIVCMHIGENNLEEAKKAHINVVIAGHMASDSLGMNLLLDKLPGMEIIACSGFIRHSRSK